jgi:hypothetical protein
MEARMQLCNKRGKTKNKSVLLVFARAPYCYSWSSYLNITFEFDTTIKRMLCNSLTDSIALLQLVKTVPPQNNFDHDAVATAICTD